MSVVRSAVRAEQRKARAEQRRTRAELQKAKAALSERDRLEAIIGLIKALALEETTGKCYCCARVWSFELLMY